MRLGAFVRLAVLQGNPADLFAGQPDVYIEVSASDEITCLIKKLNPADVARFKEYVKRAARQNVGPNVEVVFENL